MTGSRITPDQLSERSPATPPAVWLRCAGGDVAHAVRSAHTLCGLDATVGTWSPHPEPGQRCWRCTAVPDGHLTHWDLIASSGITYRQLDYWVRRGLLLPGNPSPGSGRLRTFPPFEARVAQVMGVLTAAGLTPLAASLAARNDGWITPGIRITRESD